MATELVSSEPVFANLHGYFRTQVICIAVDLGVFDALDGGSTLTAEQIADKLHLKADRLERFLRALVCINLLELHGTAYRNTPASQLYLVSSSPRCVKNAITFMKMVEQTAYGVLADSLKGQSERDKAEAEGSTKSNFERMMEANPGIAKVFAEGMQAFGRADMDCLKLVDFTGVHTAVDLGGSLGWQARELKRLHPSVEHVIVAELDDVVKLAADVPENKDAGIEFKKVNFLTDDLPQADAYLLGHIIHGIRVEVAHSLLKKVHGALHAGGLLVVLEGVLNPCKTGPPQTTFVDMIMLSRAGGQERSADEYKALLESEGFRDVRIQLNTGGTNFDVITARKA